MRIKSIKCKNCTETFSTDLQYEKNCKTVRNCGTDSGLSTTTTYKIECPYCETVNKVKIIEVIG